MNIGLKTSGLEPYAEAIARERDRFNKDELIPRIWRRDPTVWKTEDREISNRLGWLEAPTAAARTVAECESFAWEARDAGFSCALLLGMGGSSLAPEVFSRIFGPSSDGLGLEVLDSTDPAAVLRYTRTLPEGETLFLVSSKSGSTLETASFMNYYFARNRERLGQDRTAAAFVAITDPGSKLEREARRLNFRRVFAGPPDIGGRFSVFSPFGLVPAALIGLPIRALLAEANEAAGTCRRHRASENPGANLGIILGTLAQARPGQGGLSPLLLHPELRGLGRAAHRRKHRERRPRHPPDRPVDGSPSPRRRPRTASMSFSDFTETRRFPPWPKRPAKAAIR